MDSAEERDKHSFESKPKLRLLMISKTVFKSIIIFGRHQLIQAMKDYKSTKKGYSTHILQSNSNADSISKYYNNNLLQFATS